MFRLVAVALAVFVPAAAHAAPRSFAGQMHPGHSDIVVEVGPDVADILTPAEAQAAGYYLLYVNRCEGGETITSGFNDSRKNTSSLVSGTETFPEYPYGDSSWSQVMGHVRQILSPFGIEVTDIDPGNVPHTEIIACGSASPGLLGVAPFGCGLVANAIGYAFAENHGDRPRSLAETIAHEAGHTWSLNHLYDCEDPMTYLGGCGNKDFQDREISCAAQTNDGWVPVGCSCGGSTQNSFQTLASIFGTSDEVWPTVALHSPPDGAFLAPEFPIRANVTAGSGGETVELLIDGETRLRFEPGELDITAPADITDGRHTVTVAVVDQFNRRDEQTRTITVSAACTCSDDEFCDGSACFPKGTAGETCYGDFTCESGLCATSADESLCTTECDLDNDQCASGFTCFPAGDTAYCWPDSSGGCGCQASGKGGIATALLLLGALLFVRRRRDFGSAIVDDDRGV